MSWSDRLRVLSLVGAAAAVAFAGLAPSAEARGFVAFSFGGPVYYRPAPYYYYPPPPVYYAPPPVYYAPPPAYYPPPAPAYAPSATTGQCREYTTNSTVGGQLQQTYGTACLQPDGTWRIVR